MIKLFELTKRRDACYHIRLLTPASHLTDLGYEIKDELLEMQQHCPTCRGPIVEYHFFQEGKYCCRRCGYPFPDDTAAWKKKIIEGLEWADIVVFQRVTDLDHLRLIKMAKDMGKKVVVENDDDYFNVENWNPGYAYYVERRGFIEECYRASHGLTVTTDHLKTIYDPYNKNIAVIPNSLDLELIDAEPPMMEHSTHRLVDGALQKVPMAEYHEARKGKVVIGWSGSPTHELDLQLIIPGLKRLVKKEPNIIVALGGYLQQGIAAVVPKDRFFVFSLVPTTHYYMFLKGTKFDVSLAPVVDVMFNRSKSPLKIVEAHAVGSMGVASNNVTYRDAIHQGFLSHNGENEWFYAMRKAAFCEDRAERLSENRKFVEEKFNIKTNVNLWNRFFRSILES